MPESAITTEHARAKLNLALHITGRRADGYHLMESLVAFADVHDLLRVELADELRLNVIGEFAQEAGAGEGNLVLKAATALKTVTGTSKAATITLEKQIPVGAGLGGGSADAAAILRLLNRVWETKLDDDALIALAKPLGADVTMCLTSSAAIATGIGDELTFLGPEFPRAYAVLVHPRLPLLTADIYRAFALSEKAAASNEWKKISSYSQLIESLHQSRNDLQMPAFQLCPVLNDLVDALKHTNPAPDLVRMTGSGACCFALHASAENANAAAQQLTVAYPNWWVRSAIIG